MLMRNTRIRLVNESEAVNRMPCRITDGPQTPEDEISYGQREIDEDAAYEAYRQYKIDEGECLTCQRKSLPDSIYCEDCEEQQT